MITGTPLRASRSATKPIRMMFVSRSSFEKPRPFERFSRTMSPSSTSSGMPRSSNVSMRMSVIVDLPEPERPVIQRVKPLCFGSDMCGCVSLFLSYGWGAGVGGIRAA